MRKHRVILSACIVAALTAANAATVHTSSLGRSVGRQSAAGATPEALADGKRLYDANCANCHGARGQGAVKAGNEISIIAERGGKQPPDLTDSAWDHGSSDTEIKAFTLVVTIVVATAVLQAAPDWPQWQGADRNRSSKETGLLKEWPSGGPRVIWTANNLGTGYGSMAVAGDRVFLNLGTHAAIPDIPGLRAAKPLTHIEALELDRLPSHLILLFLMI